MNLRFVLSGSALLFAALLAGKATFAAEPVLGGPCEGCEWVFRGQPAQLASAARIAPDGAPGEPMRIEGEVRDAAGQPVAGIIVYAYQTDAGGVYPRSDTRHGAYRGWARSDAAGRFVFDSVRPGAYPGQDIPQHVHFHVIEPGRGTYYIDDLVFDDDPLLDAAQRRQHLTGRGGDGLGRPQQDADGVWRVRRDIVLGAGIAGYPAR